MSSSVAGTPLPSKKRYEILDGLRGVAALVVVAYHLFETYSQGPLTQILNHGYLAVDFFFALSGFVVGYAYDDRWGKLSTWEFFKRRLVRLHPMLLMGTFIGALLFYFGDCEGFPLIKSTPWWRMGLMFLLGCTMLPALPRWDIRGWTETNSLNGATWTLLWEYLANILYALVVRHFSKAVLAVFVACTAFFTIDLTMNLNVTGLLPADRFAPFTVIGGWSITPSEVYIGLTRLFYPFFAGLLLSRINKLIRIKNAFAWCSLAVAAILVMPRIGGTDAMWMNGTYEALAILVLFPLIVVIGAGSDITHPKSIAVCKFFGDISYPLYVTHFPLVYLQMAWAKHHPDAPLGTHIAVACSVYILAIGLAYASLKLYDIPVRDCLAKHVLGKRKIK